MITLLNTWKRIGFIALLSIGLPQAQAQSLKVTRSLQEFKISIDADSSLNMVELTSLVPRLKVDLRYATNMNFTGVRLYPKGQQQTYLRKDPATALSRVAIELEKKGIGLWVWDAYRPYAVTVKFWKLIHDERYVANPSKGSGHNRGIAVDLTLYDLKNGSLLDMPTAFDDFSENAHHGNNNLSEKKIFNRELLREVMERNGFIKFQTEWWHYYWPNGDRYDVLDIPFKELNKPMRAIEQ
jgi:D-alanyl-D-alanine dipeptidase